MSRYAEWLANNPPSLDMPREEQQRFRKQIVEGSIGIGDCWVWNGARTSDGYGNIWVGYTTRIVSRLALCLDTNTPLSVTADACHVAECPSRACCNPAHLFWGDHNTNCATRESRDARWDRYMSVLGSQGRVPFVVFEKRYQKGWGWLDCRSVQGGSEQRISIILEPMPNPIVTLAGSC